MDWQLEIGATWLYTAKWVAGLTIVFGILARFMPCNRGMHWWKDVRGGVTDAIYWFIVPLFLSQARVGMLIAGLVLFYGGGEPQLLPVKQWPLWLQCVTILVIQDVMLYGTHRASHSRL